MITRFRHIFASLLLVALSLNSWAGITDLPTKVVNGRTYYYYEIQPQETMYSLCKRFGLTQEEIKRNNPSTEDGLKAYQILLFPVEEKHSVTTSSTYEVQKGDTGYGISKKFGMALDDFYALNPSARDGLKSGQKVFVKSASSPVRNSPSIKTPKTIRTETIKPTVTIPVTQELTGNKYTVQQGDTFYSIARAFGLEPHQLMAANQNIEMLQPGMQLNMPQSCDDPHRSSTEISDEKIIDLVSAEDNKTIDNEHKTTTIALVLPLQAGQVQRSRQAQYYADFVKGFMLAVDSVGTNALGATQILVIDTKGSNAGISAAVADPRLKTADIIIATDDAGRLKEYAAIAGKSGGNVLNLFSIKNQLYLTNPTVMQANIPHTSMYDKAIDYYINTYTDVVPVILKRTGGASDKQEFVDRLKSQLSSKGRKYQELTFNDNLSSEDLSKLSSQYKYAFIPTTSNTEELDRIVHAIGGYKDLRSNLGDVSLWGYAEWLKLRGSKLEKLHELNTTVFSRFFSDTDDPADEKLKAMFLKWYGQPMMDGVPSQATFGFDTAMYLLRALSLNGGNFDRPTPQYTGIQNTFDFSKVDGGGYLNDEMYMINFAPSGATLKTGL